MVMLLLLSKGVQVQAQSLHQDSYAPLVQLHTMADLFYTYDFSRPATSTRQPFLFHYNRHNEINLNLGIIGVEITNPRYRMRIDFQAGTYAQDNYAAEESLLQHVFQANIGLALNKQRNLWLEAGIFPSHLGFESALTYFNPTLTRSLVAENSPYFLSGAMLQYEANTKWNLAAIVANGWQRIQRVPGNSMLSFGTQVGYKIQENSALNWSTFITTEDPDTSRRMRYFNNVYADLVLANKWQLIAGFDHGLQQAAPGSSKLQSWWAPTFIVRYHWHENWATAIRAEYYHDPNEIIVSTPTLGGFEVLGFSLNIDYAPKGLPLLRVELRNLNSQKTPFATASGNVSSNWFISTSLSFNLKSNLGRPNWAK